MQEPMARAVEADRVAVFFQEAAPSLWVEALRCQSSAVSSKMYHQASTITAAAIGIVSGSPPAVSWCWEYFTHSCVPGRGGPGGAEGARGAQT